MSDLVDQLEQCQAKIGILGLGYVGLPLAIAFAQVGFSVIGFDLDVERVLALRSGWCPPVGVDRHALKDLMNEERLYVTSEFTRLREVDVAVICVPTPLTAIGEPDLSHIILAAECVAQHLHKDELVVLESTSYPGTTDELLLPILDTCGLMVGDDFFLACSPERIDPGNSRYTIRNTPKLVGGITKECGRVAVALYSSIVDVIVPVRSTRTAEMAKLLENTFRAVNIGLVNELAQAAGALNIDLREVIEAAATKPFGYMPFYPGPGIGGHCIPVDPEFLAWKLRRLQCTTRFIDLALEINREMPSFVSEQVRLALNRQGKRLEAAHVLILGVTYKANIDDVRESPALRIIEALLAQHAIVSYSDPFISHVEVAGHLLLSQSLTRELLLNMDCAVIVADHSGVDYDLVVTYAPLVIDTRNTVEYTRQRESVRHLTSPLRSDPKGQEEIDH